MKNDELKIKNEKVGLRFTGTHFFIYHLPAGRQVLNF